jgi:hypothetical protein
MGETETERVATAHAVQEDIRPCGIDLEPKRVRKSTGKCGPNKHYFSHFDYAYKGIKMAGEQGLKRTDGHQGSCTQMRTAGRSTRAFS